MPASDLVTLQQLEHSGALSAEAFGETDHHTE